MLLQENSIANIAEIRGDSGVLVLRTLGYEQRPGADSDDRNWLRAHYKVMVRNFSSEGDLSVQTFDLKRLHSELAHSLETMSGLVSFAPIEPVLHFEIRFEHRGRAQVSGVAEEIRKAKCALSFCFDTDQSFLSESLAQLSRILISFPER